MDAASYQETLQSLRVKLQASTSENRRLIAALNSQTARERPATFTTDVRRHPPASSVKVPGSDNPLKALEDSLDRMQSRVVGIEEFVYDPTWFTPTCSVAPDTFPDLENKPEITESPSTVAKGIGRSSWPVASQYDALIFDPDGHDYLSDKNRAHLYTNDLMLFIARLKRLARYKRIDNVAQFLGGAASRFYHASLSSHGEHMYEADDGTLDVVAFCRDLQMAFAPDANSLKDETQLGNFIYHKSLPDHFGPKLSLIHDYAVPLLEQARDSHSHSTGPLCRKWVYDRIVQLVPEVERLGSTMDATSGVDSMTRFLSLLVDIEKKLKEELGSAENVCTGYSPTNIKVVERYNSTTTTQPDSFESGGMSVLNVKPNAPPLNHSSDETTRINPELWASQLDARGLALARQSDDLRAREIQLKSRERAVLAESLPPSFSLPPPPPQPLPRLIPPQLPKPGPRIPPIVQLTQRREPPADRGPISHPRFNLAGTRPSPHNTSTTQGRPKAFWGPK